MNTDQKSKLNMYLAIMDFLKPRITLLSPLPNFMVVYDTFVDSVTEIQRTTTQQSIRTQEVTKIKEEVRASLLSITAEIAHQLNVLAHSLNDQVLLAETHFTQNEQEAISDLILADRAMHINNLAERYISGRSDIHDYDDILSKFKNEFDTFIALMPGSALSGGYSRISNLKLEENFRMADESLLYFDTLINIIQLPQSHFYRNYFKLRKLQKYSSYPVQLKGRVWALKRNLPRKEPLA